MTWLNIGGYSLATLVMLGAGWILKNWLYHKIKADVDHAYKQKDVEFKNNLNEKTQIAITSLNAQLAERLKWVEHGYNEQLEQLRAQLQNESFKLKEEKEHDRKIFERLMEYCDETNVRHICRTACDGFYDRAIFMKAIILEGHAIKDENQFVNENLRNTFLKFHESLSRFTAIVSHKFFNVGGDRFMLHPELKRGDNEQRRTYEAALSEVQGVSDKILDTFSDFRQTVKQTLYV